MSNAKPRTCINCGGLILNPGGPRTNTCSPECKKARTKALKHALYERSKLDPAFIEYRTKYNALLAYRRATDIEFAERARAQQRLANQKYTARLVEDADRYEDYKAKQRAWRMAASPAQKEALRSANRKWYASLDEDSRKALISASSERRRQRKLRNITQS